MYLSNFYLFTSSSNNFRFCDSFKHLIIKIIHQNHIVKEINDYIPSFISSCMLIYAMTWQLNRIPK
jgi:hypothetical protein